MIYEAIIITAMKIGQGSEEHFAAAVSNYILKGLDIILFAVSNSSY